MVNVGIARFLDEESLTKTQAWRGPYSPLYTSPEQLNNQKSAIGPRTDQYNLGILLLQLIMHGQHPFDPSLVGGDSVVENIANDNWYRLAWKQNNLQSFEILISTMLGKEPFQRFRKTEFLLEEIDRLEGELQ